DQARTALTLPAGASCQTFGLYKLAFPRRELVARAGRRLGRTLVERWMSKDGAAVREAAEGWVAEHWSREEHGPEGLIERLQAGAEEAIRHVVATLQKVLEHHEPLLHELRTRADDAHVRTRALIDRLGKPGGGKSRQLPAPSEVQELLRCFAKWRYQGLVLQ